MRPGRREKPNRLVVGLVDYNREAMVTFGWYDTAENPIYRIGVPLSLDQVVELREKLGQALAQSGRDIKAR